METNRFAQLSLVIIGLIVGLYAVVAILLNPTGGIAGLSKLITLLGIILGLVNPRAGLYFLVAQAMYSDEMKRVAVYYGVTSELTIREVLIGPLLTLTAVNISFVYNVLRGKYKLGKLGWALYAVVPLIGLGMLIGGGGGMPLSLKLYNTATISIYITLMPICYGLLTDFEDWIRFISTQVLLATPATAWGIWQYFNGFNNLEWSYAQSGLSPTHSAQMLFFENPRVFGFFGSASAYGCVTLYGVFALWRGLRIKKYRFFYISLSLIFAAGILVAEQRSMLIYPPIILAFAFLFRRFSTTVSVYASIVITFVLGVLNATYLLNEGLEKINNLIRSDSKWGESVLTVNTFAERLYGWERLGKLESWTLFGNRAALDQSMDTRAGYNHDIINKILIQYGAAGLFTSCIFIAIVFYLLHRTIYTVSDPQQRKDGAFAMACVAPVIIMSFIGGDNFSTTPNNMQIWSIFAGVFVLKRIADASKAQEINLMRSNIDTLPQNAGKQRLA